MYFSRITNPVVSSCVLLLLCAVAGAGETAEDPEPVIVTAFRVAQDLHDVPMSVTVLDAATLEDAGVHITLPEGLAGKTTRYQADTAAVQ